MWLTTGMEVKRASTKKERNGEKIAREKCAHFCNFDLLSFVNERRRRRRRLLYAYVAYVIIITFAVIFLSLSPSLTLNFNIWINDLRHILCGW